jgi:hypothetical protein
MKRLCFIALVFVLLLFPSKARADVAPPQYPPGSNPQPGAEITQVRMVAETVVIEVQKDITPGSLGEAHVSADFSMHNLGTVDESMTARFPIAGDDGFGRFPEIENLQIKVNDQPVRYQRKDYPDIYYPDLAVAPWAEFDVTFPAGQDVSIHVAYDLDGSGYYPFTAFTYILTTGAGWQDTIGKADIILRLPYEANPQNVFVGGGSGWAETTPGGVFQGKEVRWHFEDFEPGRDQQVGNMEFMLVAPFAWQTVLSKRENVARNPNDGEAWGGLAKAYKQVTFIKSYRADLGGQELYKLSVEAYEKCLSLKPEDAQWHAGFADLLAQHAWWDSMFGKGTTPEAYRALKEIRTALELAPGDPVVREIALRIAQMLQGGIVQHGGSFDFPWLTQTPTQEPPFEPTIVPPTLAKAPEAVMISTRAPEATSTPAPQRSSPFCRSAALLPLIVAGWFVWKRK